MQYMLEPLPPASRAADQLNSVEDDSRVSRNFNLVRPERIELRNSGSPELLTWPAVSQQGPLIYRGIGVTMKI
jgi:hypothetical protein